jgi:hypothetical protein
MTTDHIVHVEGLPAITGLVQMIDEGLTAIMTAETGY